LMPDSVVTPELLEAIGDNLDRQVSVSFRARTLVPTLYAAARERQGGRSLILQAAERLSGAVGPGDYLFIASGWVLPGFDYFGETDGPTGSASLARAAALGLQAKPVILVEEQIVDMFAATCRAAGLSVVSLERLREFGPKMSRAVAVVPFPIDPDEAERESRRLLGELNPRALVAVEKNGPGEDGEYHMLRGYPRGAHTAKAHILFRQARERGILTIGIGDLGNELGMGLIADVVHEVLPVSRQCKCPGGKGSADSTPVDVCVVAEISNWAAYGIAACLGAMLGMPELLHDGETESRMLRAAADFNAIDGVTALVAPSADGVPEKLNIAMVEMLRGIAELPVHYASRPPFYFGLE
jgi:D-glutamate cyclase